MKTLDIIEENLTKDEFISFLKGTIIKFAIQGQNFGCAMNIKRHADKLVEVLEQQRMETQEQPTYPHQIKSFDYTQEQPTVDPDEPQEQPKSKFNIGDRVIVKYNDFTGTIVRLPMSGVDFSEGYVVQLDNATNGFECNVEHDGVDCYGGWFATDKNLELIHGVALQADKWYHTTDFTVDELSALLPSGTKVEVEAEVLYANIETTPPTKTKQVTVESVTTSAFEEKVFIAAVHDNFYKEWFKIVQEV
jgi:hypothetical protein|nr:MAG TPA: hypothetical protein [Caudoviricetes sp.]